MRNANCGLRVGELPPAPWTLRECARALGLLAESNPRLIENHHWQVATEGLARLVKDVESLNGVIVPVNFVAEALAVAAEDPRQLNLRLA